MAEQAVKGSFQAVWLMSTLLRQDMSRSLLSTADAMSEILSVHVLSMVLLCCQCHVATQAGTHVALRPE